MDDLLEFDDDQRKTVVRNLKNPSSTMIVARPKSPLVPIRGKSYAIGARSLSKLKVASEAGCYYDSIGRTTGPVNMDWTTLLYFDFQWKALLSIKSYQSDLGITNLTKNIKVMKWAPTIIAFWTTYIGARNLLLTYFIQEDPAVTQPPLVLEIDRPYSAPNDNIYSELVQCITHIHPLFTTDNQVLYDHLEKATRLSLAAYSVTQYRGKRNGRGALKDITSSHCETVDWEDEITRINLIISSTVWKGTGTITLTMHCNMHRYMNEMDRTCGVHVTDPNLTSEQQTV